MSVSYQNSDNFIRNLVTIKGCWGTQRLELRRLNESENLPIDIEDVMTDLRVDSPDDERETVLRYARLACGFIERRTACVCLQGEFEVLLPSFWDGAIELRRFPFRQLTGFAYLAAANTWTEVDLANLHVDEGATSFFLEAYPSFDRPDLWSEMARVRLRFSAGWDDHGVSGSEALKPIMSPWPGVLTAVIGHYFQNRELMQADRVAEVEQGLGSLLASVRTIW